MDFARKQLEKYGWTDGNGLGKHGNGISEPIKAKLKRSTTGVGYNPAADFTEHWWSTLYDKAANNVMVENKNGKTKRIRRKSEEEFTITNSSWKLNKKRKDINSEEKEYSEFFVRTAILADGGAKTIKVENSDSESEDDKDTKNVKKLTDEELFAACQGRTAHKGARHGLRALGKLARIEQQEKIFLQQEKYNEYSHCMKIKNALHIHSEKETEDVNNKYDGEANTLKKEKKKKGCSSKGNMSESGSNSEESKNNVNINEESNINQLESEKNNAKHADNTEDLEKKNIKKKKKKKITAEPKTTFNVEDNLA